MLLSIMVGKVRPGTRCVDPASTWKAGWLRWRTNSVEGGIRRGYPFLSTVGVDHTHTPTSF